MVNQAGNNAIQGNNPGPTISSGIVSPSNQADAALYAKRMSVVAPQIDVKPSYNSNSLNQNGGGTGTNQVNAPNHFHNRNQSMDVINANKLKNKL